MNKIFISILAIFTIISCQKESTQVNNSTTATSLLNPPTNMIGEYYDTFRYGTYNLEIKADDVIYEKESFTEKFKNYNLRESHGLEYNITTDFRASVALGDVERYSLRLWRDSFIILKELKINGRTKFYLRKK